MKKNIKIIMTGFLLALVMFCGLLAVQRYMLKDFDSETAVVAIADIPAGTQITNENVKEYFTETEIQVTLVTENTVKDIKSLYDCYNREEISEGEIIYNRFFTSDKNEISPVQNPIEISIALSSFADGVSGTLRKGDFVSIMFVDREKEIAYPYKNSPVYIKEAFNSSGEVVTASDISNPATVFTVVINGEDSEDFCTMLTEYDVKLTKVCD